MKNIIVIATLMLLCAASCKKDKASEDQLPPATQSGANTFGCLVNGKVFEPKGYDGTGRPNPHVQYDYDLNGQPYLTIDVLHYLNGNSNGNLYIGFGNLTHTGAYLVPIDFTFLVGWNILGNCNTPPFDSTLQRWGSGVITKLDIPNQIIAGHF